MVPLRLENVSKRYGKTAAVDHVSFELKEKEFVVIFGSAGAGKTTTLNLIAGIATPDAGKVWLQERVANTLEPSERNIAMVFENYALYPQMTAFENMAFPLRGPKSNLNEGEINKRVTQVGATLKIDHLLDRSITALSNGQRQRVALGRALVRKPAVFLMDEPLSHLDAKLRNQMRTELKLVQSELDTTTLYVTHDYLEALSLGDRIIVLDEGRVLQIGTPDEVYLRPQSVEVAQGFGDPEINMLSATLHSGRDGQTQAVVEGGQFGFEVPPEVVDELLGHEDLLLGFRPADLQVRLGQHEGVRGTVYSYEPLGAKAILIIKTLQDTVVRALVDAEVQPKMDQTVSFTVKPDNLIFFDKGSGQFLARAAVREADEGKGVLRG